MNSESEENKQEDQEQDQIQEEEQDKDESKEENDTKEDTENSEVKEDKAKYEVNEQDSSLQALEEKVDKQKVLITIDDAPDTYSVEMAEYLAEEDVPAIFFVNGHFLQDKEGKEDLKKIHDMGFEIGNHTMNHVDVTELSEEELEEEIVGLNDLIEEIIGERPDFFRAPFGINSNASKELLTERGMVWMNWTYGYDWEADYQNAEDLSKIMVETELLRNGSNLLMHDREWTKEALPNIIEGFREKGYGFINPDYIQKEEADS
ncbi:polysaccharide deacetylase family protein [Salibacterium salarium]|uniref:Polysaccharide deacetylase family protein n=2 Tax=Salibacterium salarium TaxID=284579 RepID=A0A3R9P665_9BACI|nr:polysaccharide deacetylase family protein [Salibacterium salarium]